VSELSNINMSYFNTDGLLKVSFSTVVLLEFEKHALLIVLNCTLSSFLCYGYWIGLTET